MMGHGVIGEHPAVFCKVSILIFLTLFSFFFILLNQVIHLGQFFFLRRDDILRQGLKVRYFPAIVQITFRHFDGRLVMGNHSL